MLTISVLPVLIPEISWMEGHTPCSVGPWGMGMGMGMGGSTLVLGVARDSTARMCAQGLVFSARCFFFFALFPIPVWRGNKPKPPSPLALALALALGRMKYRTLTEEGPQCLGFPLCSVPSFVTAPTPNAQHPTPNSMGLSLRILQDQRYLLTDIASISPTSIRTPASFQVLHPSLEMWLLVY